MLEDAAHPTFTTWKADKPLVHTCTFARCLDTIKQQHMTFNTGNAFSHACKFTSGIDRRNPIAFVQSILLQVDFWGFGK